MSFVEGSAYCSHCGRRVLARKPLHVVTAWRCAFCGTEVRVKEKPAQERTFLGALFLFVLVCAILLPLALVCSGVFTARP